jgi:hypothetical protein
LATAFCIAGANAPNCTPNFNGFIPIDFDIHNHASSIRAWVNALWRITADYQKRKTKSVMCRSSIPTSSSWNRFAYTQFWDGPEGLSEYRDLLRRIWDEIERTTTAKRLFCIAPAPPRDKFLEGARNFQNTRKPSERASRRRFDVSQRSA